ncbi:hypothetical protein M427DRAFT_472700 [Gonapodya prolifera JEL478]|uniref:Uncharacterized protein n=1 Tax=Gonapodya prolifera (strain JEL478) TaxID=1344416 RepID=A0A139AR79_GONPJ|nr:hypothetical protein M427DRAFT_472700 [Gonapodya prolifera JEL478]|eukprot:KXS19257.1 hypothetical protein M427DRAFT_472700 [Gonapodya prolifera JEL478]
MRPDPHKQEASRRYHAKQRAAGRGSDAPARGGPSPRRGNGRGRAGFSGNGQGRGGWTGDHEGSGAVSGSPVSGHAEIQDYEDAVYEDDLEVGDAVPKGSPNNMPGPSGASAASNSFSRRKIESNAWRYNEHDDSTAQVDVVQTETAELAEAVMAWSSSRASAAADPPLQDWETTETTSSRSTRGTVAPANASEAEASAYLSSLFSVDLQSLSGRLANVSVDDSQVPYDRAPSSGTYSYRPTFASTPLYRNDRPFTWRPSSVRPGRASASSWDDSRNFSYGYPSGPMYPSANGIGSAGTLRTPAGTNFSSPPPDAMSDPWDEYEVYESDPESDFSDDNGDGWYVPPEILTQTPPSASGFGPAAPATANRSIENPSWNLDAPEWVPGATWGSAAVTSTEFKGTGGWDGEAEGPKPSPTGTNELDTLLGTSSTVTSTGRPRGSGRGTSARGSRGASRGSRGATPSRRGRAGGNAAGRMGWDGEVEGGDDLDELLGL